MKTSVKLSPKKRRHVLRSRRRHRGQAPGNGPHQPLRRQLRSLGEAGLKLGPVRQQRRAGGRHGQKTTEGILVEVVEVWRSSNGKSAIFNGKITIFNGKIHYKGPYYSVIICIDIVSGWWLTYPSEKYESQWEGLSHISG